jgi:ABC-type methionine transport system ATPase subunit
VSAVSGLRVRLTFPETLVKEPLLGRVVQKFDVLPNIRRANVEEHAGWIQCELEGDPANVDQALRWLQDEGVGVQLLGGDILE